jgi:hypothetical protein
MSTIEKLPDYDYAQTGLEVEIRDIFPDSVETSEVTLAIPRVDIDDESWDRTQRAIANPQREGRIGYVVVPPAEGTEGSRHLQVYNFPWGGNTSNHVGEYELAMLAASRPDMMIMSIDSPATGASLRLSSEISREIARTGSYIAYGELAVDALRAMIAKEGVEFEEITFSGASQGARRAIGMAACAGSMLGNTVTNLNLIDPVGSHEQSLGTLAKAFMQLEGGHTAKYTEASTEKAVAAAQAYNDSPQNLPAVLMHFMRHGGFINQMLREPQAMARDGLRGDIAQAAPLVTGMISIASPELSELTHPEDALAILKSLAADAGGHAPGSRFQHRLVRNQTHAIMAGHPGTLGVLLSPDLQALSQ